MNKNLVKYPIRFGTLLLAGAALVACKKDEFTEKDALTLEQSRLAFLESQKIAAEARASADRAAVLRWQRTLDSLDKINAGGRVYYTVIPVAANETTFSSGGATGGGRTEEAITNATVTISQYGRAFTTATTAGANGTPLNPGGTALNGVYTFSELRSGEVSVKITATGFTELNYVANLTPDGGIPNGGTVNVGNVVPMFEIAAGIATNKMAVVKGKAWFEGDLTNTTTGSVVGSGLNAGITDEVLTDAILNNSTGAGTVANLVTASIDVTRNDGSTTGLPYFHRRFLSESNGEGVNAFGVGVNSGAIQRFSYSKAVTYGTVNAAGEYAMLIPASAAGLPIRLNYSEFAFNRTYWNAAGNLVTNERFLYGPNVVPTDIPQPVFGLPTFNVQAFETAAEASASFTPQVTGAQLTNFASATVSSSGFYAMNPTVTVTNAGAGTGATFEVDAISLPFTSLAAGADRTAFESAFRGVSTVKVTAGGSGYTSDGDLVFTRTDIVTGAGFGGQVSIGGATTGGYVPLSTTTPIQVTDGGSNFLPSTVVTGGISTANTFTNFLPTVVFSETDQPSSSDAFATKGYLNLNPNVTDATARVFVDYNANYTANFLGVTGNAGGGGGVGAIQEVQFLTAGLYPSTKLPFVNFSFGETIQSNGRLTAVAPAVGASLFVSNGAGGVKFNNNNITAAAAGSLFGNAPVATLTATDITFTAGWGSRYTFVPSVRVGATGATAAKITTADQALRNIAVTTYVNNDPTNAASFGRIVRLSITSNNALGSGTTVTVGALDNDFFANGNAAYNNGDFYQLIVEPNRYGNTLRALGTPNSSSAQTSATGSALNTYSYNTATSTVSAAATALAAAVGGAKSNSSSASNATAVNIPTAQLLRENNMLVIFSAPNNTAAASNRFAWGVPTWAGNNTNILTGARIIDGGSGYNAPVVIPAAGVQFTSSVTASLVPNPWYRGNVPAVVNRAGALTNVAAPANITTDLGSAVSTNAAQDILGLLNHTSMTAAGRAIRPVPTITRARLTLTIDNAGAGYSRAPRFVFAMPGFNLIEYDVNAAPTATGTPKITTSAGAVITFNTRIDATGKVVAIGNATTNGFPAGAGLNATTAGLTQLRTVATSTAPSVDVPLVFEFPQDKGLSATAISAVKGIQIEELSAALTLSLNTPSTGNGVGARAIIGTTGTGTNITGTVSAVRFREGVDNDLADDLATNAKSPQVDISTSLTPLPNTKLVPAPFRISVVGATTGTAATVQGYVTLDPNVAQHRRISRIAVVSGGSGYGVARVNSWFRAAGGGVVVIPGGTGSATTAPANGNGAAGQPFTLFGNFGNGTQQGQNQNAYQFDAYPGLTYVRDVHYGTGQRLD
jgi:hypothetical protein